METREKVAHLLRRFGLGASEAELDSYGRVGVDGALNRLLHYEGIEETFNVDPWSFTWNSDPKNKVSADTGRFVAWWTCKMVFTNRPLQQNLALFWHNHFAVAESKIQNGPMMLGYLQTLEANAHGNFRKILST